VLQHKKVKNIEYNAMGDKTGRIHMQKQELDTLQLRKVKALKKDPRPAKRAASAVAEDEATDGMEVDEDM
jgi:ribosome production factor 2